MDQPLSHSGATSEHLLGMLEVSQQKLRCPPAEASPDLGNVYAGQLAHMPSRQHAEVCVHGEQPGLKEVLHHAYALDLVLCMPSQHCAIGLQTDCMVVVPAPVMRLPDSHVYAVWP